MSVPSHPFSAELHLLKGAQPRMVWLKCNVLPVLTHPQSHQQENINCVHAATVLEARGPHSGLVLGSSTVPGIRQFVQVMEPGACSVHHRLPAAWLHGRSGCFIPGKEPWPQGLFCLTRDLSELNSLEGKQAQSPRATLRHVSVAPILILRLESCGSTGQVVKQR